MTSIKKCKSNRIDQASKKNSFACISWSICFWVDLFSVWENALVAHVKQSSISISDVMQQKVFLRHCQNVALKGSENANKL